MSSTDHPAYVRMAWQCVVCGDDAKVKVDGMAYCATHFIIRLRIPKDDEL